MAKSVHDDVLDGALNIVKNNATRQVACSAEPTTYTEGNATYALADITVASGDFTAANGSTSGMSGTIFSTGSSETVSLLAWGADMEFLAVGSWVNRRF